MIDGLKRRLKKAIRLPKSTSHNSGLIDKRARVHHDALWRSWYFGLQAITIPAAFNPTNGSLDEAESSTRTASSGIRLNLDDIEAIDDGVSSIKSDSFQRPSEESSSAFILPKANFSDAQEDQEDSFDSLTLALPLATAPRQEVAESQL